MTPEEHSAHERRLGLLKVQRAKYGLDCPPQIQIEIEDIENLLKQESKKSSTSQNRYTRICTSIVSRIANINRLFEELLEVISNFQSSQERLKNANKLATILSSISPVTSIQAARNKLLEEYRKLVSYHDKNRVFLPKTVNEAIENYKAAFLSAGVTKFDHILNNTIHSTDLIQRLDTIVEEMQKYLEP